MSRLKRALFCTVLGVSAAPAAAAPLAELDLCDFKPSFMEDFKTISVASRTLGEARWTAHTPWNGDFGDAGFSDPTPSGPFAVNDGMLLIVASRNAQGRWRSGLIAAADATGRGSGVQYGYFEARMRMPPGPGTWPAFWLASLKSTKDASPGVEIDVIEYYGLADDGYQSALHVWYGGADKERSRHSLNKISVPPGSLVNEFHNYGLRIAPDAITFYLDRSAVWQMPTPPELKTPMYPLIDLALGSGFPIDHTPNPSILVVNYVHVYAFDPIGREIRCPQPTPAKSQPKPAP
jgi:beta-glucanase (GH16 family)